MENIIVKTPSGNYEIDSNRTIEKYELLLSRFLSFELFSFDADTTSNEELDAFLIRKSYELNWCWIEGMLNACYTRCHLESINHIDDGPFLYDQLYFQPWENFPIITMSRFKKYGRVHLSNEKKTLPVPKRYEVLGVQEDTTQLHYFANSIDSPFVYCYSFGIIDDFNKIRSCLRFAEYSYKREALLLTQFFTISYLINHPLECFHSPFIYNSSFLIDDITSMSYLLSKVLEKKRNSLYLLQEKFKKKIASRQLRAEVV